jgi:hypothetical protein
MKPRITMLATAVATLLAATAANAQSTEQTEEVAPIGTDSIECAYNFGSGNLEWCVSSHGNLMKFESPDNYEHIRVGGYIEGYALCVAGAMKAYDHGSLEVGFGPPTLVASTATSVTVRRFTTDNRFLIDQKWTRDTNERDLTVQMTLQNLGPPAAGVRLIRIADLDVDNDPSDLHFDKSVQGLWVRDDLHAVTMYPLTTTVANQSVLVGYSAAAPVCVPAAIATPGGPADVMGYVIYDIGSMNTNAKKITKFGYRSQ